MNPWLVFWIDLVTAFVAGAFLWTLLFPQAQAAEIIFHGPSYHFDEERGYNNANFGLGYAFDNRAVVGTYYNSEYRASVYAGYLIELSAHVGVLIGAATGYEQQVVSPAVLLTFTVPLENRWRLHVNVAPAKDGLINLALGRRM